MKLRPREQQVLDCLMDGMDMAETAKVLKMSKRSVKGHRHSLYARYGITERYYKAVRLVHLVSEERYNARDNSAI